MRMGRSRSAVSNTVRLLALSAGVQEALAEGRVTAGHARALLPLPAEAQEDLARRIAEEGLTVRRVEQLAQEHLATPATAPSTPSTPKAAGTAQLSPDDAALQQGFEQALGTPVHLQRRRRGGGRLVIDFYSDEELDSLYTRLGGPQL
jgi:ParB family chromosome partitioning protein